MISRVVDPSLNTLSKRYTLELSAAMSSAASSVLASCFKMSIASGTRVSITLVRSSPRRKGRTRKTTVTSLVALASSLLSSSICLIIALFRCGTAGFFVGGLGRGALKPPSVATEELTSSTCSNASLSSSSSSAAAARALAISSRIALIRTGLTLGIVARPFHPNTLL